MTLNGAEENVILYKLNNKNSIWKYDSKDYYKK